MRNRRWLVAGVVLAAVAAGGLFLWRPWAPARTFATADELGYHLEYEYDPEGDHIHQSNPDRDGQEYVGVIVPGLYSAQIVDGTLTVSRQAHGKVQKGDRIRITRDKRVWVNGTERRAG